MYRMDEIELWNGRRHELVREAEDGRIARRLRAARPKMVARLWGVLSGWAPQASVRAESSGRA